VWSSIIVDKKLLEGSGFLARGHYRLEVQLDPKLISVFIERWGLETNTFHLPCGECTITLEDVQLQLGLLVDGSALTRFVQSTDWKAVCYDLFGAISDNIYRGRIKMGWLWDTFPEPGNNLTEVERIRYARAYILQMIGGYLMPDLVAGEFSWGSIVLAKLYREMYGAT
ncbi:hypothetical protein Gotur_010131, partial [Gossypium turneri]